MTYVCPMHLNISQNRPGRCSICAMALVQSSPGLNSSAVNRPDHQDHPVSSRPINLLTRFWLSLGLTVPILIYSDLFESWFGRQGVPFPGSEHLGLVMGTIVFFYGGAIFLVSAWRELKARQPGMMTLIALAATVAYSWSLVSESLGTGQALWWELASLITVMLLGHHIEMKSVQLAQGALKALSNLVPDTAQVVQGKTTRLTPVDQLKLGDLILIKPGVRIPADSQVIAGVSSVNEAIVTGESKPVDKTIGDQLIAGSINTDGSLTARINKIGDQTFLAGIARLISQAQESKSRLQLLSDRAAGYLTYLAVGTGLTTLVVWLALGSSPAFAIERLVAVVVIACPHALGLAIPLVATVSTSLGARSGLLIRDRLALEKAGRVSTIMFDKTGTLTTGAFSLGSIWPIGRVSQATILELAAGLEAHSEHPIGQAIVARAKQLELRPAPVSRFRRLPGQGVAGSIDGRLVKVVSLTDQTSLPKKIQPAVQSANRAGLTLIVVSQNETPIGVIALADQVRPESKQAVRALSQAGLTIGLLTGDAEPVARSVAAQLGIKKYFSGVKPDQKTNLIKRLQNQGQQVAMVGDGVNDAPALAQADVGIAIGAGTNVAIESAGIILVRSDPRDVFKIVRLSRATKAKMIQNLFWATGYNLVAVPLAAGVALGQGIVLAPTVAAGLMSVSTVIVALNALLLKQLKLSSKP